MGIGNLIKGVIEKPEHIVSREERAGRKSDESFLFKCLFNITVIEKSGKISTVCKFNRNKECKYMRNDCKLYTPQSKVDEAVEEFFEDSYRVSLNVKSHNLETVVARVKWISNVDNVELVES